MADKPKLATPLYSHMKEKRFENVYDPAEDSFLMMDALEADMENILKLRPTICLEIGTGSGALLTFLASILGNTSFNIATDINEIATECAMETSLENKATIQCIVDDLVTCLMPRLFQKIDIIIFNPPYVVTPSSEVGSRSIEAACVR